MKSVTDIKQNILDGLNSAVNLQIVTYVGNIKPTISSNDGEKKIIDIKWDSIQANADDFAIATQINLVQGDIITITPLQVHDPDKQWLQEYHLEQVKAGKEIVASNLKMLAEMAEKILAFATPESKANP